MRDNFMDKFLRPEHRQAGFHIVENYPDGLTLVCPRREPAYFGDHACIEQVLHEADQQLNWMKSGVEISRN